MLCSTCGSIVVIVDGVYAVKRKAPRFSTTVAPTSYRLALWKYYYENAMRHNILFNTKYYKRRVIGAARVYRPVLRLIR